MKMLRASATLRKSHTHRALCCRSEALSVLASFTTEAGTSLYQAGHSAKPQGTESEGSTPLANPRR